MQKINLKIRTSEKDWLETAIKYYSKKEKFILVDDAQLGLKENDLQSAINLLKALKDKKKVSWKEITGILLGLGISSAGIWMVAAAIADPEPTSKLGLLIAGGIVLVLTGGFASLLAIGVKFNVKAKALNNTFEINPL